jgi:Malic enzyme
MDPIKARYARSTSARTLGQIVDGADVFLGVSAGGVLKPEMVKRMAKDPLILALANPNPEIAPEDAKAVRPDTIIARVVPIIRIRSTTYFAFRFCFEEPSTLARPESMKR